MSKDRVPRLSVIEALLAMTMPTIEVKKNLNNEPWDYTGQGVMLTKQHIINALRRYIDGQLSEIEIEQWANQIEGREDIYPDPSFATNIEEVIYELANPYLTETLTIERALNIQNTLKNLSG